jgi:hypothetical protein
LDWAHAFAVKGEWGGVGSGQGCQTLVAEGGEIG